MAYNHFTSLLFGEDIIAQDDRDTIINWTMAMLGDDPSSVPADGVTVELGVVHYDAAIDDALQEYSTIINEWSALDNISNTWASGGATTEGNPEDIIPIEQRRVLTTFGFILQKTRKYSEIVQAGGNITEARAYFNTVSLQQHYDLLERSYEAETASETSFDYAAAGNTITFDMTGTNITDSTEDDWEYIFEVSRTINSVATWVNISDHISSVSLSGTDLTITFDDTVANIATDEVHYSPTPRDGWDATEQWKFTAKAPFVIDIYDEDGVELKADSLDRKSMEINNIEWFESPTIFKYYDPYNMGATIGAEAFGFGFTVESPIFMYPVYYDILRGAQHELANKVRRHNHSIKENNKRLSFWPVPGGGMIDTGVGKVWIDYQLPFNPYAEAEMTEEGDIANLSNMPYFQLEYVKVNSMGQRWVRKFSLASSKEILGRIRGKYTSVPVPNAEISLDAPSLIEEARSEKEELRASLRELLEKALESALVQVEAEEADNLHRVLQRTPSPNAIAMG